jgi:hypothetical protein
VGVNEALRPSYNAYTNAMRLWRSPNFRRSSIFLEDLAAPSRSPSSTPFRYSAGKSKYFLRPARSAALAWVLRRRGCRNTGRAHNNRKPIMPSDFGSGANAEVKKSEVSSDFFRFHTPHLHLGSLYGEDCFALKAEAFARFFGTPVFHHHCCDLDFRQCRGLGPFRCLSVHSPQPCFQSAGCLAAPLILLAPDPSGRP